MTLLPPQPVLLPRRYQVMLHLHLRVVLPMQRTGASAGDSEQGDVAPPASASAVVGLDPTGAAMPSPPQDESICSR